MKKSRKVELARKFVKYSDEILSCPSRNNTDFFRAEDIVDMLILLLGNGSNDSYKSIIEKDKK